MLLVQWLGKFVLFGLIANYVPVWSLQPSIEPDHGSDPDVRYEYLQYHEEGVVGCHNKFRDRVAWNMISGNKRERIHPCPGDAYRICESVANLAEGGFNLRFLNVTMEDNNTTYYCTHANKLIHIFVKAPETDPEIRSLTTRMSKRQMYTKKDADYYYFGNKSQPMIRVKCGVSIKTTRQFSLNWYHATTNRQITVLTSEESLPDSNSFSFEPRSWLRSTDKWLDMYLLVHKLKTMSGDYTCYVQSPDFYQQRVPVSRVIIRL